MNCSCSCCPKWLCGVVLLALLVLTVASLGWAPESGGTGSNEKKPAPAAPGVPGAPGDVKGDPYMLSHCAACDAKLDDKAVVYSYEGRELRFCCNDCQEKFKAAPAKFIVKIDEEMIKQQMPLYPLDQCIVMPEDKLQGPGLTYDPARESEHDVPVNLIYKNRLVRFCCGHCVPKFQDDAGPYLKKLDEAVIARQSATYALTTCPVSGEKLGGMGEPVSRVIGNQMVKLCCKACVKELRRDPAAALAKVTAAEKDKKTAP